MTSRYPLWEGNEKDPRARASTRRKARRLTISDIVLPYRTIKPMIVAGAMVIMFCGLILRRALIFVGAATMVCTLYSWLLSPLEPEHH